MTLDIPSQIKNLFEFVEAKMKLNIDDTYYIADSYINDIIGARNVGWKAVWFNRRRLEFVKEII